MKNSLLNFITLSMARATFKQDPNRDQWNYLSLLTTLLFKALKKYQTEWFKLYFSHSGDKSQKSRNTQNNKSSDFADCKMPCAKCLQ